MPLFGVARQYTGDLNVYLKKLHQNSIEAYEIGFANGVPYHFPQEMIELAYKLNIKLSGHIPFFLSWSNDKKSLNSIEHLRRGINFAAQLKTIAVCHLGYYGMKTFEELRPVMSKAILNAFSSVVEHYEVDHPVLGIETTGKSSEIGLMDEVLSVVSDLSTDLAIPVVDWAHIFARSDGKFLKKMDDFHKILTLLEDQIGIKNFYFHGSGIEYKNGQEKKHISLRSCKPPLPYLFAILRDIGYEYTFIVESPDAVQDLIWIKEVSKNPEAWFDYIQKQNGTLDRWIIT
jgi:deoxyribonuclease-4